MTSVFFVNMHYKVDNTKLKEVFNIAGKVLMAEVNLNKKGKSRGAGVVQYEHPVKAVQASSMLNNQILHGRKLQ